MIEVKMTFASLGEMMAALGGTHTSALLTPKMSESDLKAALAAAQPAPVGQAIGAVSAPTPADVQPAAPAAPVNEGQQAKKTRKKADPVAPAPTPTAEAAAQDAKDEAPAAPAAAEAPATATIDDVRNAMGAYVKAFGMAAAQEDGPKLLVSLFGEGVTKISAIPNDAASYAKALAAVVDMTKSNPNKRPAVAA